MARKEEQRRERRQRDSDNLAGIRRRLLVDESKLDRENFVYRFVNDTGDRVRNLEARDWDIVTDRDDDQEIGAGVGRRAGAGDNGPMTAVLMRKYKDWYDDDYAKRQNQIDATEDGLRRGSVPGGQTDEAHVTKRSISISRG